MSETPSGGTIPPYRPAGDTVPAILSPGGYLGAFRPAAGERLYTLSEARTEIARGECAALGHDLEAVTRGDDPVALHCTRPCGHRGYRVTPIGDVDPRAMLLDVAVDLWHDLAYAYAKSEQLPRETSVACNGLIKRIQDIARVVGPVPPGQIECPLLLTGLYETVHAEIGLDVEVPEHLLDAARFYVETAGPWDGERSRGLAKELDEGRRIYYATDASGARFYTATDRGGWLPGEYTTVEAAEAAYEVPRDALERLADWAVHERRRIAAEDVADVVTVLAAGDEASAR